MAYQDNAGGDRKMYQGDWKCSKCEAPIKELPFEPDPSRLGQLLCRDCHKAKKQSFGGGGRFFRR